MSSILLCYEFLLFIFTFSRLDDQIWGSDEEKDEEEEEDEDMNDEDNGKGSKEEEDVHNDLANKNDDTKQGEDQSEGLDAADSNFFYF